jgi:serine/threonine-protein kinase
MRPVVTVRARGVLLSDVASSDLVPVQKVVAPKTRGPLAAAAGLSGAALLVALLGLAAPSHSSNLGAPITINSAHASGSTRVPVDLTKPLTLQFAHAAFADQVKVSLDVLGSAIESKTAPAHGGTAVVPALGGRYLVGGHLTLSVALLDQGRTVGTAKIPARTKQSSFVTATAGVDLLVLLFAGSYVESFLRSLRRTRRRTSATVGATLASAVFGAGLVAAAWVALGREPSVVGLVVTAVISAAAGTAAAIGCSRIGQRNRFRRRQARTAAR